MRRIQHIGIGVLLGIGIVIAGAWLGDRFVAGVRAEVRDGQAPPPAQTPAPPPPVAIPAVTLTPPCAPPPVGAPPVTVTPGCVMPPATGPGSTVPPPSPPIGVAPSPGELRELAQDNKLAALEARVSALEKARGKVSR